MEEEERGGRWRRREKEKGRGRGGGERGGVLLSVEKVRKQESRNSSGPFAFWASLLLVFYASEISVS